MLVIRPTLKLATQMPLRPLADIGLAPDPNIDWCVRSFQVGRSRYLLFSNTRSLFSVIAPRRGVVDRHTLIEALRTALRQFLGATGHTDLFEQKLAPHFAACVFARNQDRSVVGSMNDLAFLAEGYLESGDLDIVEVHRRLNSAPMGALKMKSPSVVFHRDAHSTS